MKRQLLFTCFVLLSTIFGFSQTAVTIDIETLTKPEKMVQENSQESILSSYSEHIEKTSPLPETFISYGEHSFLRGILTAYQEHRPIVISPDIIWLLISQGFSRHITNHAEEFRKDFVNFSGKKELIVNVPDITLGNLNNNWEQVFPQFSKQIADNTSKELIDMLTADFSTTTPTTKIASQITIMESFKDYFDYKVRMSGCGIPKITIEGTTEDWEKVLQKTQYISKYNLTWWTSELKPILIQIINATKGNVNKNFWMKMVKIHTAKKYGSTTSIDGWITKFFPYTEAGEERKFKPIKDISDLAPELVKVPFLFNDITINKQFEMEFWTGFIGWTQNKSDYTLRPQIAWIVSHKQEVSEDKLNPFKPK
jgi:hypothetical protein